MKKARKALLSLVALMCILISQQSYSHAMTITLPIPTTISIPYVPPFPPIIAPILDDRFTGNPGDINETDTGSYKKETHIGDDGKADAEKHNTDHGQPKYHDNPHYHKIDWNGTKPDFGPPTSEHLFDNLILTNENWMNA
ncbi:hypothetical protein AN1V17_42950 [Vallitalea sediminicola]